MSLYPTLEDLVVDEMAKTQIGAAHMAAAVAGAQQQLQAAGLPALAGPAGPASLYAGLGLEELLGEPATQYAGLDIGEAQVAAQLQIAPAAASALALRPSGGGAVALPGAAAIARVTPVNDAGMAKAEIHAGVKALVLRKEAASGKLGFATKSIDKGVFVAFVWNGSPAARDGLRFGDQILMINGKSVAGWDEKTTLKALTEQDQVHLALRERPFCRTVTTQKDSHNHIGFVVKGGEITQLVVDSSAARNGLLINSRLIEVNGQNVVGMADKDIISIIQAAPRTVTVTVLPTFIYKHLVKKIGESTLKKHMDHGIPEL